MNRIAVPLTLCLIASLSGQITWTEHTIAGNFDGAIWAHALDMDVIACDRIQALVTVEPTAMGFQAMPLGLLPVGLQLRATHLDHLVGALAPGRGGSHPQRGGSQQFLSRH